MKSTLLFALLPLVFSTPQLLAKSDLEVLRARCAEQERQIRELEDENAKLRSLHDVSVNAAHAKAVVGGAATAGQAVQPTGSGATYVVRAGDSWARIAGKFGIQSATLAELNGLKETSMIRAGQKLKVPGTGRAAAAGSTEAPTAPQPPVASPPVGKTHLVKQGETFYSIAKKYGVSMDRLMAANPNIKASAMRPGQVVQLAKVTETAEAPVATAPRTSKPPAAEARPSAPRPSSPSPALAGVARTSIPISTAAAPVASPPAKVAATAQSTPCKTVMIDGRTTFGEFASQHRTNVARLNDLNALDLVETTVLAKGSELYVPAQP